MYSRTNVQITYSGIFFGFLSMTNSLIKQHFVTQSCVIYYVRYYILCICPIPFHLLEMISIYNNILRLGTHGTM